MERHYEAAVRVAADPGRVFAWLDDQTRLAAHMQRPSAMMGGGRMTYELDVGRGQAVGSHIRMGGAAFGLSMSVDEVVTEREPPRRKVWKTVGTPRMLIIDRYEMGFEIAPDGDGSRLRVWIDYDRPARGTGRWLGLLLGASYARWCVGRMVSDAVDAFAAAPAAPREAQGERAGA